MGSTFRRASQLSWPLPMDTPCHRCCGSCELLPCELMSRCCMASSFFCPVHFGKPQIPAACCFALHVHLLQCGCRGQSFAGNINAHRNSLLNTAQSAAPWMHPCSDGRFPLQTSDALVASAGGVHSSDNHASQRRGSRQRGAGAGGVGAAGNKRHRACTHRPASGGAPAPRQQQTAAGSRASALRRCCCPGALILPVDDALSACVCFSMRSGKVWVGGEGHVCSKVDMGHVHWQRATGVLQCQKVAFA